MHLPAAVERAVGAYLVDVDAAVPDLVEGVYLTGSVVLDDFQPEISDIDVVAVCAHSPQNPELDALATIHRPARPHVDVLYLSWDNLQTDPTGLSAPHSHEGTFHWDGAFAANPVEWRTLQTRAIAVRGPHISAGDVWFDAEALRRWNANNLDDYRVGRLDWTRRMGADRSRVAEKPRDCSARFRPLAFP